MVDSGLVAHHPARRGIHRTPHRDVFADAGHEFHRIREVEINPLVVRDEGSGATAVDALVTMERAPDAGASA